jgi:hypothetical protein
MSGQSIARGKLEYKAEECGIQPDNDDSLCIDSRRGAGIRGIEIHGGREHNDDVKRMEHVMNEFIASGHRVGYQSR